MKKIIPLPDQIRKIPRSFGWIDHRLLRDGFVGTMGAAALSIYSFLVLAADREGVSYYHKENIGKALDLDFSQINQGISHLIQMGLIAFLPFSEHDPNGFYQVLNLPPAPKAPKVLSCQGSGVETIGEILQKMIGGK